VELLSSAAGQPGSGHIQKESHWLDSRVSSTVVAVLEKRGISVVPDAAQRRREESECAELSKQGRHCNRTDVDTGLGSIVVVRSGGRLEGAIAPWPGVTSRFVR
jgi:hypothetical protein